MHPALRSIILQTIFPVGLFSFFTNLLILVLPLYMLQIFDRVLSTRSVDTLITVTVIALVLVAINAALEFVRDKYLAATGRYADEKIASRLFDGVAADYHRKRDTNATQAFQDLEMIRKFLGGRLISSLFDAPWSILFLFVMFLLSPLLGYFALAVVLIMIAIGVYSEVVTKETTLDEAREAKKARILVERSVRNFDSLISMGIVANLKNRWLDRHNGALAIGADNDSASARILAVTHFVRYIGQISVLGLAGYLAITDQISPGMLIAANILFIRAIGPFESVISLWTMLVGFREALHRLNKYISDESAGALTDYPRPEGRVSVERVTAIPPESSVVTLNQLSISVPGGQIVGIHGPSGAGKSSLAKILVGAWPPAKGIVRYDGYDIATWSPHLRGQYVGYLPQDVELFDGTVSANISRFDPAATIEEIIQAARAAGAHDMILGLKDGYDTHLGVFGGNLSGGQKQRVGLARALFRKPPIIVLDEPDSALDTAGLDALQTALTGTEGYRPTVFLISHNTRVLNLADRILAVKAGRIERDGDRKDMLQPVARQPVPKAIAAAATAANKGAQAQ